MRGSNGINLDRNLDRKKGMTAEVKPELKVDVVDLMEKVDVKSVATDYASLKDLEHTTVSCSGFLDSDDEYFFFFKMGKSPPWKGAIRKEGGTYVVYSDAKVSLKEVVVALKFLINLYKKDRGPESEFFLELEGLLTSVASRSRVEEKENEVEKVVKSSKKFVL